MSPSPSPRPLAALLVAAALAACGSPAPTTPGPCDLDNGGCGENATCRANGTEAECSCHAGFVPAADGCTDVDECLLGLDACDPRATCTNTPGSYTCACAAGDLGDGTWCGRPWTTVAIGAQQTCAIRPDGSLWCWGSAQDGVLGTGATSGYFTSPQRVGSDTDWERVFAGTYVTCGQKTGGALWCWGRGADGVFGNGTTENSPVPVRAAPSHTFREIAIGIDYICGLEASGGLWCWGWSNDGQLGTGSFPPPTGDVRRLEPQRVDGTWASVSARVLSTCAIRTDGTLWCWGRNMFGEVGDGTTERRPGPVQVGTDTNWVQVETGHGATCGRKADGSVWCWGRNARFDQPTSHEELVTTPVRLWGERTWASIHLGAGFACGEKPDGTLWCGGSNAFGQLGVGLPIADEPLTTPARVGPTTTWTHVALGESHGCAIRTEGVLQCWGFGGWGSLGIGDDARRSRNAPVAVH